LTLFVAWACVLVAAGAVAGLLAGVIRLSERRAAFVSAVTHELRTPLTTFHMYTEMLTAGMVPDADRQQDYLNTLRVEASRLSHLVENVLAYARLERGRTSGRVETLSLARLIDPIRPRLADRAVQAGMELAVEAGDGALEATVRANPSAVEQILFNLVDNACKYAAGAADKRIHLSVQRVGDGARIAVRDHGPGISGPAARRLFRPFSKSAREAANSAPGIGLGLALSHRLAGDMGGRLDLDQDRPEGACFVLSLPAAE
jgi:signal transduction histidine kinase